MSAKSLIPRVILGILLLCAVVWCAAGCQESAESRPTAPAVTEPAPTPEASETVQATAEPAPAATAEPEPAATDRPTDAANGGEDTGNVTYAAGYVRVSSPTVSGWLPLPAEEDYVYPLRQMTADGTVVENQIHLTPNGVFMESATCDNQDCVHQGMVTLDNMEIRALQNMIICLPNQVYLELYSIDELLASSTEQEGASP